MSFESFADFIAMGGHGLYVWLSYSAAFIVVLANVFGVRMARNRVFRQGQALERRATTAAGTPSSVPDPTDADPGITDSVNER